VVYFFFEYYKIGDSLKCSIVSSWFKKLSSQLAQTSPFRFPTWIYIPLIVATNCSHNYSFCIQWLVFPVVWSIRNINLNSSLLIMFQVLEEKITSRTTRKIWSHERIICWLFYLSDRIKKGIPLLEIFSTNTAISLIVHVFLSSIASSRTSHHSSLCNMLLLWRSYHLWSDAHLFSVFFWMALNFWTLWTFIFAVWLCMEDRNYSNLMEENSDSDIILFHGYKWNNGSVFQYQWRKCLFSQWLETNHISKKQWQLGTCDTLIDPYLV